jgi:hypothetical protein
MRLVYKDNKLVPHFTVQWEVTYLAEHPNIWVPFCRIGHMEPLGDIHSTTLEIRIREGYTIANRQVVVLGPEIGRDTQAAPSAN